MLLIYYDDMSRFKYLKLIAMHWGKISRPEAEARLEKVRGCSVCRMCMVVFYSTPMPPLR